MGLSFAIIFLTTVILGSYVGIKYSRSRNKKLFFNNGAYKAFIYSLIIIIGGGLVIYLISPEQSVKLKYIKFHSDFITDKITSTEGILYYWYKSISIFSELNVFGLLAAIFITAIWFYFIKNLDFFNREKTTFTILTFVLGTLFTFLTFPFSDFIHHIFSIEYTDNRFYNLFVYSFLGIGVVEELIKIIPVLIILFYTKEIDEPIDLIYYASISALGFAFIENLLYFRDVSGSIVVGRALTSAVGHMVDSSIIAYGIILFKFRKESVFTVVQLFMLGAFAHGLYDFLIFEELTFLFFAFFAFFIQSWAIIINNAINNSKYFDYSIHYKHDAVRFKIALLLSILMIFSLLLNGFIVGRDQAFKVFLGSLGWSSLLILFYVGFASSFDLFKGHWRPIKFTLLSPNSNAMPGVRILGLFTGLFTENTIVPLNHVGKKIKIHSPRYNKRLLQIFRRGEGKIVSRHELISKKRTDREWFLIKLNNSLDVSKEFNSEFIMIKLQSKYMSLVHDKHIRCFLKLIPKGVNPATEKNRSEYISFGYIIINGFDYEFKSSK
ncbi:PrsW family intramembrane metalloprotease [Marivirga arenosa]|uniref:PrsW family intramembrane metalloprotease n=1 Tax=Marivirga arenosa TaxID=3059076 RepID=A0AA52EYN3_9BACT|nr:PrsW family intramembrane metalloprotease [Marivirga sp. BKB1-2]WNB17962.1 PrsW family intramembrane metalloprotease [Marivirga sp. BKB1-2]